MLFSSFICGAVLLAAPCLAAPAELGLKFNKRAGALPTLTLPYGTWQASSYNPDGDVCHLSIPRSLHIFINDPPELNIVPDLYIQKYPLWSSSGGELEMGQARPSSARVDGAGWFLRPDLYSGAHQGPSADGSGRQLAHRNGREPISGRHTATVLYGCL